ncbi:MAG: DUF1028 domain-containing protein [Candidatus Zixiibacteriota bacterium]|nr:MAG: DUF1028 domain-containing protein [candidate division Zixibacteria bacterium]
MKLKSLCVAIGLMVCMSAPVTASSEMRPLHPVTTYSIVCFDSTTGQFGAAVQSHWFKVADVIWAEPAVGVVATQSLADFRYGPLGLEMMRNGKTAGQALAGVLASDPNNAVRQVAMIDRYGNVASHTGDKCIAEAGHRSGRIYSVQANLMRNNTVWDAMAEAFESAEGDLADKMMAALEAAEAQGGDIRGKQSAAMIVVAGEPTGLPWADRIVDIRVDDAPEPLVELKRLLNITRAYDKMNEGDELIAWEKFDEASAAYEEASRLAPGNPEILFWYAVTLASAGETERSLPIFKQVFEMDESWRELVPRLVASELLPDDQTLIGRIVDQ